MPNPQLWLLLEISCSSFPIDGFWDYCLNSTSLWPCCCYHHCLHWLMCVTFWFGDKFDNSYNCCSCDSNFIIALLWTAAIRAVRNERRPGCLTAVRSVVQPLTSPHELTCHQYLHLVFKNRLYVMSYALKKGIIYTSPNISTILAVSPFLCWYFKEIEIVATLL